MFGLLCYLFHGVVGSVDLMLLLKRQVVPNVLFTKKILFLTKQ